MNGPLLLTLAALWVAGLAGPLLWWRRQRQLPDLWDALPLPAALLDPAGRTLRRTGPDSPVDLAVDIALPAAGRTCRAVSRDGSPLALTGLVDGALAVALPPDPLRDRRDRLLADLGSRLAHDLNTPLAAVLGHLDLIGHDPTSEQARSSVAICQQEITRAHTLARDLLTLTRLRAGTARRNAEHAGALLLSATSPTAHSTARAPAPAPLAQTPAPPATEPPPTAPTAAPGTTAPTGSTPQDLTAALQAATPSDGTDPRISGVYGSGHHGTWQFTAFLTWRTSTGGVQGGRVDLPIPAGDTPIPVDLGYPDDRLHREHDIGWTPQHLDTALHQPPATTGLAMLELQIPASGTPTLTTCTATSTRQQANCTRTSGQGHPERLRGTLTDQPDDGALAVQRQTAFQD